MNIIFSLFSILTITSVLNASNIPDQDRYQFFNPFGNDFLAPGTANISLLVSQDLKGEFDDVIVTVTTREDKITSHLEKAFKFFRGEGDLIANDITLSDYINCNITQQGENWMCTGVATTMNDTAVHEANTKERFRIIPENNQNANINSLYCIGFNLRDGMVQIYDYNSLLLRFCPNSKMEDGLTLKTYFKPYFSKFVLTRHAMRLVRKAFDDQLTRKKVTILGKTRESQGYAMELLDAANIDFPQKIAGWTPAYDYFLLKPMESFIRKIHYAEHQLGLDYYKGSSNRRELKTQLGIGVS